MLKIFIVMKKQNIFFILSAFILCSAVLTLFQIIRKPTSDINKNSNLENFSNVLSKLDGLPKSDILLIINYNHAHYDSIPFLETLYSSFFPKIVFYGPQEDDKVICYDPYKGWFSYGIIKDAMDRFPDFKGYFFVHDDCIINPWNISKFDKNKIWYLVCWDTSFARRDLTLGYQAAPGCHWWKQNCGYKAIKKVYETLPEIFKNQIIDNCGQNIVCKKFSDIVYLPARFKENAKYLISRCLEEGVFLEIAIPNICLALDNKENWEILEGISLWGNDRHRVQQFYNTSLDYLHPFKLSLYDNRDFIIKNFATFLTSAYSKIN